MYMLTVDEHNALILRRLAEKQSTRLAGVLCPQCNAEMIQDIDVKVFDSLPPKIEVRCAECDHINYKII